MVAIRTWAISILTLKFLFDILMEVARRQVDVQTGGSEDRPRMNKRIWKWLASKLILKPGCGWDHQVDVLCGRYTGPRPSEICRGRGATKKG